MLPKKLSSTKLETMRIDACLRFRGVFSPYEFNAKPVKNINMIPREIPVAETVSPNAAANTAGAINSIPENCRINPRLPQIGL